MENGTFKQLTVGDKVYKVKGYEIEHETLTIEAVKKEKVNYGYRDDNIPRIDKNRYVKKKENQYSADTIYFTIEAEALRYCKARLMKKLFSKIDGVKKALQNVKDFKTEHWDLLQNKFTEPELNKLEKEIKAL